MPVDAIASTAQATAAITSATITAARTTSHGASRSAANSTASIGAVAAFATRIAIACASTHRSLCWQPRI